LGVPLGSFSFISFFFQDVLNDDVQHIDAIPKLGDVHVAFGIHLLFHPKALLPSLFFPPTLDFSIPTRFLLFNLHLHIWEIPWVGFLECPKVRLVCRQAFLPISKGGIGFVPTLQVPLQATHLSFNLLSLNFHSL
jgi:hypothetical protein